MYCIHVLYLHYNLSNLLISEGEIHRRIVSRSSRFTNFLEFRNYKIIYKRYAGLYFILAVDIDDNELKKTNPRQAVLHSFKRPIVYKNGVILDGIRFIKYV
jgi:hypothetical protein